jgi:hypothetical protein
MADERFITPSKYRTDTFEPDKIIHDVIFATYFNKQLQTIASIGIPVMFDVREYYENCRDDRFETFLAYQSAFGGTVASIRTKSITIMISRSR